MDRHERERALRGLNSSVLSSGTGHRRHELETRGKWEGSDESHIPPGLPGPLCRAGIFEAGEWWVGTLWRAAQSPPRNGF